MANGSYQNTCTSEYTELPLRSFFPCAISKKSHCCFLLSEAPHHSVTRVQQQVFNDLQVQTEKQGQNALTLTEGRGHIAGTQPTYKTQEQHSSVIRHVAVVSHIWFRFDCKIKPVFSTSTTSSANGVPCLLPHSSSVASGKQRVNGVDLYYEQTGTGKHAVLLLPGALGKNNNNNNNMPLLRPSHTNTLSASCP